MGIGPRARILSEENLSSEQISTIKNEIIDHYALKTGFSTKDIDWYYAFGAFKLAVIIQQIYVRFLKGQTQDKRFANFGKRIEALINRANAVFNFN